MLPKFFLCDNTDHPEAIFIFHTEFPRFIINLADDEVEWFDQLEEDNEVDLEKEVADLLEQANAFYDREIKRYEELD